MTTPRPSLPVWIRPTESAFIGRRGELETLNDCWEGVSEGRGRMVLVSGDAGIGKSRLVSELAGAAHDSDAVVLCGSCEKDHPKPFQPFVDALAPLGESLSELGLDNDHEVRRLLGAGSEYQEAAPRHRMFESVLQLIDAITGQRPAVLILEDLHWAAQSTLELLGYVARHGGALQLLTVGTFRPTPKGESSELRARLTEIYRQPGVVRIDVAGLTVHEIVQFLMTETGAPKSRVVGAATTLRELTGGNPFYLRELWNTRPDSENWIDSQGFNWNVPPTVVEAVRARLDLVASSTVRCLVCASVLGAAVDSDLVANILTIDVDEVRSAFEEAVERGLMARQTPGTFQFAHDLSRQAILDGLAMSDRAEMHERTARVLETRLGDDDPTKAATLAFHYSNSLGQPETAGGYFEKAGEQAQRALAYEEAAQHFTSAATHVSEPLETDRLLVRAADNLLKGGKFSAAAREYDVLSDSEDPEVRALAAIGLVEATWRPGRFGHEAAARLITARKRLDALESSAVGVELRCYLALALGYAGAHEAAEEVGQAALSDARQLGDRRLEAKALLYPKMTSPDLSQALYERVAHAHQLVVESADLDLLGQAAYMRGSLGYVMGDPEAWTGALSDLVDVVEGTDQPFHRLALQGSLCSRAFSRGEFEQALGYADAFSEMAEVFGDDPVEGLDGAQRFMVERETGLDAIRPLIKGEPDQEIGSWRLGLLALYTELDLTEPLRVVLDDLMTTSLPEEAAERYQGAKAAFLTDAIAKLRHQGHAERLYEILRDRHGTNLLWGHFVMVFGSADRYLGMLADVLGRDATSHFEDALEMDTTMGATQHRAETLARFAEHMSRVDDGRSRRLAAEASELGRLMGSRRIERLARLGPAPRPDGLTTRELEVLSLVADGYSNREIAAELFISLNTATNHVRSILIKTGCNNRTQAARYALDAELIRR